MTLPDLSKIVTDHAASVADSLYEHKGVLEDVATQLDRIASALEAITKELSYLNSRMA